MRLDLYQAETERVAVEQTALLDEAREALIGCRNLSALESNGVLHSLQVLIENSIGKAKQWLKAKGGMFRFLPMTPSLLLRASALFLRKICRAGTLCRYP